MVEFPTEGFKLIGLHEFNPEAPQEEWAVLAEHLNDNSIIIGKNAGARYLSQTDFTIRHNSWKNPVGGKSVPDVQKLNGGAGEDDYLNEELVGVIVQRAFVTIEVIKQLNVQFTDMMVFPTVKDLNADNVNMRKEIARCGVDLVNHTTPLSKFSGAEGIYNVNLMFQAVTAAPSMDLKFTAVFY